MSFPARFPGTCSECGERWRPGDPIRSFVTIEHSTVWVHDACPESTDPATLRKGEKVCTDCWLVHPEGACDR